MAMEQYSSMFESTPFGPMALVESREASTSNTSDPDISGLARVELEDGRFAMGRRKTEVVQETE